jgi:hypothetical protein
MEHAQFKPIPKDLDEMEPKSKFFPISFVLFLSFSGVLCCGYLGSVPSQQAISTGIKATYPNM